MSRFTMKDVFAVLLFLVIIFSGTAASYFRWFRSRGISGAVRESVETKIKDYQRPKPVSEVAEQEK